MCKDNIMYHFYLQAVMEFNRLVLKQFFGMRWLVGGVRLWEGLCKLSWIVVCYAGGKGFGVKEWGGWF